MAATDAQLRSLHRYFVWSNRMRSHFEDAIKEQGPPPDSGPELWFWLSGPFCYASYWFASLFVVVEGWEALEMHNEQVAMHLSSSHRNLLRRFRNGVYHFQETYFDERIKDFMTDGSLMWVRDLHDAVSRAFLDEFRSRGIEVRIQEQDDGSVDLVIS